ncbi:phenylacetate-CoA oxygenase subunit PaaC [Proteobacteria bacterium 005FR1]|nr:phenylacetate-CoA oxygenase subunit PaaC [Proteobacteria bacterium 005FR1]
MKERKQHLAEYCISLADDALVLGQRLSQWVAKAPWLEEELALANVALDLVGRAKMLYEYAARVEGGERSADDIAFLRDTREYRNLLIAELPVGDFAFTMARQLMVDAFNVEYLKRLQTSSDSELGAIAAKAIKESEYHLRRSHGWVLRLGDGTDESHARIQQAFDELWAYAPELFEISDCELALLGEAVSVDRRELHSAWDKTVSAVLEEATLQRPDDARAIRGGRQGIHTEHLGHLLAEMQFLQRAYPGLEW